MAGVAGSGGASQSHGGQRPQPASLPIVLRSYFLQQLSGFSGPVCKKRLMTLRSRGAYRRGQQGSCGAFGDNFGGHLADKHRLPDLQHGDEKKVWGDADYYKRESPGCRGILTYNRLCSVMNSTLAEEVSS
jgi:hypothetical protein